MSVLETETHEILKSSYSLINGALLVYVIWFYPPKPLIKIEGQLKWAYACTRPVKVISYGYFSPQSLSPISSPLTYSQYKILCGNIMSMSYTRMYITQIGSQFEYLKTKMVYKDLERWLTENMWEIKLFSVPKAWWEVEDSDSIG